MPPEHACDCRQSNMVQPNIMLRSTTQALSTTVRVCITTLRPACFGLVVLRLLMTPPPTGGCDTYVVRSNTLMKFTPKTTWSANY